MENKRTRGNFNIMYRLVGLVRPLAPVMVCAVLLGVAGFLCAIFIPVLGVYALLDSLHFSAVSYTHLDLPEDGRRGRERGAHLDVPAHGRRGEGGGLYPDRRAVHDGRRD